MSLTRDAQGSGALAKAGVLDRVSADPVHRGPAARDPRASTVGRTAGGGVLVGAVAAAPALGSVVLSSLITACLGCLGVAPAVVAGAAAGVGVSSGGVLVGLLSLLGVLAVQALRLRRSCLVGRARRRAFATQAATVAVVAAVSFVTLQWVVAPALAPPTSTGAPTLP